MKSLAFIAVFLAPILCSGSAKAWDVNNWMDRSEARTCSQLVQTSGYFLSKYYSTGNTKFKDLANETIDKAKRNGCN